MPDANLRSNMTFAGKQVKVPFLGLAIQEATIEVAAGATSGTEYRVARLPLSARIHGSSRINADDLASTGSPTLDIGVRPVDANFTFDLDAINDGISAAAAVANVAIVKDIANFGKQLWEIMGLTSNPGGFADVVVSIQDAATNDGGTLTTSIVYSVD